MAITSYNEGEHKFWKVYVHYRSSTVKTKRFQKTIFKLKSEKEALKEEKKLIKELTRKVQIFDGLGLPWNTIVSLWWQEVQAGYLGNVSIRSAEGYLSIINKWTQDWNEIPASEISRADARKLLIELEKANLSKAYQKKVKNIINKVYEWGIEFGYIKDVKVSPMKGLFISKGEQRPPEILGLEEIKRFLTAAKAVGHHWYPIWTFAILTGMRSGELHALSWDQIDLEKDVILVDRSYESNSRTTGSTKGRYWRTIPINASLRQLIIELKTINESCEGYVLPRSNDWDCGDQARPLRNFLKSINMKSVKFHALRACFATQMLANGVAAPVVMKIGGWKKSSTMDIYLRLAGVDTKGATDCLEFVPSSITFGDNVVSINKSGGNHE
ncbi:MAG: site-specific integrase [Bacteriovoracaceae bacterium]|nr:site-specific integrase [Bacteriovoracaceae bacterium]